MLKIEQACGRPKKPGHRKIDQENEALYTLMNQGHGMPGLGQVPRLAGRSERLRYVK